MQFWLGVLGALLVALGVLSVAMTSELSAYADWLVGGFWQTALFVAILLPIAAIGWLNLPNRLLVGWAKIGLIGVLFGVFWLMIGIRVLTFATQFEKMSNHLSDGSKTVVATVQIRQISDTRYDNLMGQSFRQEAVITNIRPNIDNKINHLPQLPNPFFDEKYHTAKQSLANAVAPLPDLTVMLNANPPTNPLKNNSLENDPLNRLNELRAGEQVQMTLALSQIVPNGSQAFDFYKYYKTRHIHANANILAVDWQTRTAMSTPFWQKPLLVLERWRGDYRQVFLDNFEKNQYVNDSHRQGAAVVLSLLTGDRSLIDKQTKALYQMAGIMHLLAISGTHILFLAVAINGILMMIIGRFCADIYRFITRPTLSFLVVASVASIYALFTGLEVPALRTVLMLICVGLCRWWLVEWSAWRILAVVGLALAVFDPFVLWQAGFWLSFVAVGLLMSYDDKFHKNEGLSLFVNAKHQLFLFIKLQGFLFVAMLPISLLLFGKVSWFGLVINLFAVSLFGVLIVPLNLLAGVLYPVLPSLAVWVWGGLAGLLGKLGDGFGVLQTIFVNPYLTMPMSVGVVVLAGLGLIAIKSILPTRLAILPILAIAFVINPKKPSDTMQIYSLSIPALSASLMTENDQNWLIVHETNPKITPDYHKELLKNQLIQLGVERLAGVVVQTNNETLAKTVGQLSLEMSIGELWWAGAERRFGKLHTRRCKADTKINDKLLVLTGWEQIDNGDMHACAVWLNADVPIKVGRTDYPTANVVFDVGRDQKLWQMWALLCRDDKKPVNPVIVGGELAKEVLQK